MTIHFAAARPAATAFFGRDEQKRLALRAANDNHTGRAQDLLLRDALKHFAAHGLGAADEARQRAERAFFAGDRPAYLHWLNICRALDRRMARALCSRIERPVG